VSGAAGSRGRACLNRRQQQAGDDDQRRSLVAHQALAQAQHRADSSSGAHGDQARWRSLQDG
jgi:hypothetical protein